MTAAEFVARLEGVRKVACGWEARCPAHEDRRASLSVTEGDEGRVLIRCHAGCSAEAVVAAKGLALADLFAERTKAPEPARVVGRTVYSIRDAAGPLVAEHVREDLSDGGKRMFWQRNGGRGLGGMPAADLPLYGSERVRTWDARSGLIVTEGEKAADALAGLNLPALGTVTGASSCPRGAALEVLRGRRVVLWPDADAPGERHMAALAASLVGVAAEVKALRWGRPGSGEDAADYVAQGGTREALLELLRAAPAWEPAREPAAAEPGAPVLIRVQDVRVERIEWLWRDRVPFAKLAVLDGDPGLGKSTLLLDVAARLTTGRPMPGEETPTKPRGVVLLSAEDGAGDTIRPRLEAAGADLRRVVILDAVRDAEGRPRPPRLPDDLGAVRAAVREVDAGLVVVDPLMAFLSGKHDSHRDQDVRGALRVVADLAQESGAAVVILRHLNKAGGSQAVYRGGGSIGIIGAARAGLLVAKDPADPGRRIVAVSKSNLGRDGIPSLAYRTASATVHAEDGPVDTSRIEWEADPVDLSANDLLAAAAAAQDGEDTGPRGEAAEFLRSLLADGPVAAKAVRKESEGAGLAWATVRRAADRLGIRRDKAGLKGGWFWTLPREDAHPTPEDAHVSGVSTFGGSEHLREPEAAASDGGIDL